MPKKGKGSAGKSQRSVVARETKQSKQPKPKKSSGGGGGDVSSIKKLLEEQGKEIQRLQSTKYRKQLKPSKKDADVSSIRQILEGQLAESSRLKQIQATKNREKEDRRAGLKREIERADALRQPTDSDQPSPAEQNRLDAMDKLARGLEEEKRTAERVATGEAVRRQNLKGITTSFKKKIKEKAEQRRLSAMDILATKMRTERLAAEEKSTREALVRQAKEAEKSRREAEREAEKSKPFKYLTDVEKLLRKRGIEKLDLPEYTSKDFTVTDFDNKNVSRVNPATAHLPSGHSSNRLAHSHSAVSHYAGRVSSQEPEPELARTAEDEARVKKAVTESLEVAQRRALEPEQSSFRPARTVRGAGGAAPSAGKSLSDIFGEIDRGAR